MPACVPTYNIDRKLTLSRNPVRQNTLVELDHSSLESRQYIREVAVAGAFHQLPALVSSEIELEVDQSVSFSCPAILSMQLELKRLIEGRFEFVV